ncbi:MAG TPA: hypothetical protein DEA08_29740 [Planctomycetes bacterium]|nr:hypothetical protein [Planctomycetota bacterium]
MAFQRGHALVPSVVRVVQLTGAQDLKNLEATGELNLTDLLVTASDAIFDRLVADGLTPGALANPEVYERAVAFQFLGILAAQGYLDGQETAQSVAERQFELSDRYYEQVRPRVRGGDAPRTATEAMPEVMNVTPTPLLGGRP